MNTRATAESAHRIAKLRIDERVDHDGRVPAGAQHGPFEVRDRLRSGVPHLLERLFRELRLERENEARRGLSRGVGDDMELDRGLGHPSEASGWSQAHQFTKALRDSECALRDCGKPLKMSPRGLRLFLALGAVARGARLLAGPARQSQTACRRLLERLARRPDRRDLFRRLLPDRARTAAGRPSDLLEC